MTRYAEGTTVTPDRSREELGKILKKYGADSFAYMDKKESAAIGFELRHRTYRFILRLPDIKDYRISEGGRRRTDNQTATVHTQAIRERWRALVAVVKAKLIAVENGVETFEEAFMAYTVVPGTGKTVGEWMEPELIKAYSTGQLPPMLPMPDK